MDFKREGIFMNGSGDYISLKKLIGTIILTCIPFIILCFVSAYEIYELDIPNVIFDRDNEIVTAVVTADDEYTQTIEYSYGGVQYDKSFDTSSRYFNYYDSNEIGDKLEIYVNKNNPETVNFLKDRPVRVTKGYGILLGVAGGITLLIIIVEIIDRVQQNKHFEKPPEFGNGFLQNTNPQRRRVTKYDVAKSRSAMIILVVLFLAVDISFAYKKVNVFQKQYAYDMVIGDVYNVNVIQSDGGEEDSGSTTYEITIGYEYNENTYRQTYKSDRDVNGISIPVFVNPDNPSDNLVVKRDAEKLLFLLILNVIPVIAVCSYFWNKREFGVGENSVGSAEYEIYGQSNRRVN